jgi:hypothetical protein
MQNTATFTAVSNQSSSNQSSCPAPPHCPRLMPTPPIPSVTEHSGIGTRCRRQTFRSGSVKGTALFSACSQYRYRLTRTWGPAAHVVFIGLNPSTADAAQDDPTIRRCAAFARSWGFDGLIMLNAWAFRSTQPRDLLLTPDPNGPRNDHVIRRTCRTAPLIIAAWGNHCHPDRQRQLLQLTGPLHCLARNRNGQPAHPLYLKSSLQPQPWSLSSTDSGH